MPRVNSYPASNSKWNTGRAGARNESTGSLRLKIRVMQSSQWNKFNIWRGRHKPAPIPWGEYMWIKNIP